MTGVLDHDIRYEIDRDDELFFDQSDDGKALYRRANRLVSRDDYQPNVSREVMTVSRAYERSADSFRVLSLLRRSSDQVKVEHSAAHSFAEFVSHATSAELAQLMRQIRKTVPKERLQNFLLRVVGSKEESLTVRSFVLDAQRLADQGKIDSALDLIYERADEMLLAGEFTALNEIIAGLSADKLTIDVLLAVLTISLPAKSKLPARSLFYLSVEQQLQERGEFREGLLTGLQ